VVRTGRLRAFLKTPTAWHYLTLIGAFGYILLLMRHQWFFLDEWDFLMIHGPGLFAPHVGHWSTSPDLIYKALRSIFGLHSYYPYAIVLTIIHLTVAHLAWRIARLAGANDWIATGMVAVFAVLGAGSENILWAFQIGFIGAILFGFLSILISSRDSLSRLQFGGVVAISLFSLTWSGTSIPLAVATALVLWRKHGWRRAAIFVGFTAAVYLIWFSYAAHQIAGTGGFAPYKIIVLMPLFIGMMFFVGFPYVFPVVGLGQVFLVALLAWMIVVFVKRRHLRQLLPAFALGLASVVFAILTAYSRAVAGLQAAASSRYIYTTFLLLLPLFAVALSRLMRHNRKAIVWATILLGLFAVSNAKVLYDSAHNQAVIEQGTKQLMSAALTLYVQDKGTIDMTRYPDPTWASNTHMSDLVELYDAGMIDITAFTPHDLATAKRNLGYVANR
jgi:hypothetical protein